MVKRVLVGVPSLRCWLPNSSDSEPAERVPRTPSLMRSPMPIPPIPPPPISPSLTISLLRTSLPAFSNLPPSTLGNIEIIDPFLNPANALPMLLTGTEAFLPQDNGSWVEISTDRQFDGIVACQDPGLPGCRITQH
jgi:hypothetical protein